MTGPEIRVHRVADTLSGEFQGVVPPDENGRRRREREPRLVVRERESVIEYVPTSDVLTLEVRVEGCWLQVELDDFLTTATEAGS